MSQKIKDQEKRCKRLERELNSAKDKLTEQNEKVKNKEQELQAARVDLVNLLLVENDVSLAELPSVLSEHKKKAAHSFNHNDNSSNSGETHLN